ncbi:mannosyl-oligosaccharide glucosidase GCS1 [Nasonia vitripennis]|uniref:Mannosyl-oligosaccharide glucosidase n=1 Tax=Nasonia vitripennis TaxID=7425 RepID=A0A7M7IZ43_NASVI|nr:mannosyl-oligosaccharide glucosidase GCS1 [Nasonia vitripennis]
MRKSRANDRQVKSRLKVVREDTSSPVPSSSYQIFIWKVAIPIAVMAVAAGLCYKGYNETRVNTTFSNEKLIEVSRLDKHDYYWGSYRPGVYFGMKTREPFSLVTGLMWYFPNTLQGDGRGLRHWCTQEDKLERYGWTKHDGKNFGIQEIVDNKVLLKTSFIKNTHGLNGGDWTAKINVTALKPSIKNKKISLLFYTAIEDKTNGNINPVVDHLSDALTGVEGETKELGYFNLNFNIKSASSVDQSYLITSAPNLSVLKETVMQNLRLVAEKDNTNMGRIVLAGEELRQKNGKMLIPNFIVTQVTSELPMELEVRFERNSIVSHKEKLYGENYDKALSTYEKQFDERFEKTFKLKEKGYKNDEIKFAQLAFSNMIGGIGYFYGSAQVQSVHTQDPVPYWKAPLYSAVPSRSFFPRGFLWDEGFHGLLLSSWDLDIEMDIISHWFDLMNVEGWIPREMILGEEALAKVPEEFVTQVNTNANPPTFFITLQYILEHRHGELLSKHLHLLDKLYPRLQTWFEWYNVTQKGELPSTYRWRGRNKQTNKELNPKTLTSGLDDYPRASHPTNNERHIDLRCWMALASKVMATLADILQKPSNKYENTFEYLSDNRLLNELHWSPKTNTYADFGLHTDKVRLQRPNQASRQVKVNQDKIRVVLEEPKNKFVDSSFGYVSLFPFILCIVDPNSYQLQKILQDLEKPEFLWTNYGLRSLSKSSPVYMQYNTEHDPPYWRGPIWMNLNYLTVAALHHYSKINGPYKAEAKRLYTELRKNLIKNVIHQYKTTGYIWENYGDTHGEGRGSHPFTGWTSLTVLLMAELY